MEDGQRGCWAGQQLLATLFSFLLGIIGNIADDYMKISPTYSIIMQLVGAVFGTFGHGTSHLSKTWSPRSMKILLYTLCGASVGALLIVVLRISSIDSFFLPPILISAFATSSFFAADNALDVDYSPSEEKSFV